MEKTEMKVMFKFKGASRLKQCWNLLTKGMVMTILTEQSILSIIREYNKQNDQRQTNQ